MHWGYIRRFPAVWIALGVIVLFFLALWIRSAVLYRRFDVMKEIYYRGKDLEKEAGKMYNNAMKISKYPFYYPQQFFFRTKEFNSSFMIITEVSSGIVLTTRNLKESYAELSAFFANPKTRHWEEPIQKDWKRVRRQYEALQKLLVDSGVGQGPQT
jgi:hypothetical protein